MTETMKQAMHHAAASFAMEGMAPFKEDIAIALAIREGRLTLQDVVKLVLEK